MVTEWATPLRGFAMNEKRYAEIEWPRALAWAEGQDGLRAQTSKGKSLSLFPRDELEGLQHKTSREFRCGLDVLFQRTGK